MLKGIWQDFLTIVKEEAGSRVVETWLKAVILKEWDQYHNIIYVEAPNIFVKDWIESKYTDLFKTHLSRLLNTAEPKIIFLGPVQVTTSALQHAAQQVTSPAVMEKGPLHKTKNAVVVAGAHQLGRLNPSYTFETFVVGPNNSLAYAAAQAVAEQLGTQYNPLFIYGGSGLGKTHLLHAIGNYLQKKSPHAVVLYQTTDRFVNEFIAAIRFNKVHLFQEKYRKLDLLLIDDIQFISNKEQTQEAFFHIFNALHDAHKQIVFTSDVFPRYINGLEERLRSRLEWGLVTDIHKPPLETKIAILKKKAASHNEQLSDEIAEYVATEVISNIRELEGSLVRILAFSSLTKQPLSLALAKKVLQSCERPKNDNPVDFSKITQSVCRHYSYKITDLRSNNRSKELALVRQVAMYLMKKMTDKSLREIGSYLGRKDHSTVLYAYDKVNKQVETDKQFKSLIEQLESDILH